MCRCQSPNCDRSCGCRLKATPCTKRCACYGLCSNGVDNLLQKRDTAEKPSPDSRDETLRLLEENRALLLKLAEMHNPAAAPSAGGQAVLSGSPQQAFQNYFSPPDASPSSNFQSSAAAISSPPPLQPAPISPLPASPSPSLQHYSSPPAAAPSSNFQSQAVALSSPSSPLQLAPLSPSPAPSSPSQELAGVSASSTQVADPMATAVYSFWEQFRAAWSAIARMPPDEQPLQQLLHPQVEYRIRFSSTSTGAETVYAPPADQPRHVSFCGRFSIPPLNELMMFNFTSASVLQSAPLGLVYEGPCQLQGRPGSYVFKVGFRTFSNDSRQYIAVISMEFTFS